MRVFGDNGVEFLLELQDLLGLNLDIGSLTLHTAQRLVDHHTAVRQCRALTLGAGDEQDGGHRGSHARTDRRHVARNELHGIVDAQSGCDAAARGVNIEGYILARIDGVEVQQLCLQGVGSIVVHLCAKEDDAVHHQTAVDIHLRHVKLTLLKDVGIQILCLRLHHIINDKTVHTQMSGSIFSKIVHNHLFCFIDKGNHFP